MKTINKYIFRELCKVFALSLMFLTSMLFLDKILYMSNLIVNRGVTIIEVIWMMIYISPGFLILTIPVSVLVASVVAFNHLSASNEFVAMKASGWSFISLMRPVLIFSALAFLVTNIVNFYAMPWGNKSFRQITYDIIKKRADFDIKPNVFNRDFKNLVLFVKQKEGRNNMKTLFVSDNSSKDSPKIILSKEGSIIADPSTLKIHLQLRDGTIHDLSQKGKNYQVIQFDRYDLSLALPSAEALLNKVQYHYKDTSYGDLKKRIESRKKRGLKTYVEEVALSKKFALPFSCLLFGFAGAPLGIKSSRSGKSGSYVVSALIILVYYMTLVLSQNMGMTGQIPSLFSVWIPNLILFGLTIYMAYKAQKELPFVFVDWLGDQILFIFQFIKSIFYKPIKKIR